MTMPLAEVIPDGLGHIERLHRGMAELLLAPQVTDAGDEAIANPLRLLVWRASPCLRHG